MKWYELKLVLQAGMIGVLSVLAYWLIGKGLYFSTAFVILVILGIILSLCYQQMKTIRIMERMISTIRFSDFNLSFQYAGRNSMQKELCRNMDEALATFRDRLYSVEVQQQYYDTLLSTIDFGILVIDKAGNIDWINKAANQEFNKPILHHVNELAEVHPDLPSLLLTLHPGEIKVLSLEREGVSYEMAITALLFSIRGKDLLLVSLKNIRSVLEENEIEAWQKLIRVLTHEIMNSIAPIISLSETVTERAALNGINEKDYRIMLQAMETIHRRSKGLLGFVENYRKLTRIPAPVLKQVPVDELFGDIKKLFLIKENIGFAFRSTPAGLCLMADRTMIEQVLINLIKNACEACSHLPQPEIIVEATLAPNHLPVITISDNGVGILPEVIDKIFVPFFTTKSGGSGIGLSICRQIMNRHGGTISVISEVEKGTTFTLHFGTRAVTYPFA